jgi:hypothetical protein
LDSPLAARLRNREKASVQLQQGLAKSILRGYLVPRSFATPNILMPSRKTKHNLNHLYIYTYITAPH